MIEAGGGVLMAHVRLGNTTLHILLLLVGSLAWLVSLLVQASKARTNTIFRISEDLSLGKKISSSLKLDTIEPANRPQPNYFFCT